jgi:hypothetical protein
MCDGERRQAAEMDFGFAATDHAPVVERRARMRSMIWCLTTSAPMRNPFDVERQLVTTD